jgi:hypothetical protein
MTDTEFRSYDNFIGAMPESSQRKSERRRAEREAIQGAPQFECPECHVKYAIWFGVFRNPPEISDGGPLYLCKNCHEFLGDDYREPDLLL